MGKRPPEPSELVLNTRVVLVARFPLCFWPKGERKRPLKVGIIRDLYERCPDIPADLIRKALADYCLGPSYQVTLLKAGEARLDLDGNPCGMVTERHSAAAVKLLSGRPSHATRYWLNDLGLVLPKQNPAEAFAAAG